MLICKNADNTIRWKQGERLNHLFERRCDEVPADHLAVITEDVSLTFRELDNRANQAARYLLDQGLKAGDRIGLLFDKSIHSYVALLAVLKIGAAYVPFDAGFPTDRIAFILEDAGVKAILSVSRYREKLADFTVNKIFFDEVQQQISEKPTARLTDQENPPSSDQLFYVIYTSGTTGKPKGVAIEHAGICNFVKVAGEVYGIRESDRCYQGMTLAFDFHVEDLWVPLIAGATLISGKSGTSLFGNDLHAFLLKNRVTVLPCVPTLWATLEQDLPDVRIILLSGESVPHNLVVRWHRPDRSILNAYGPTECSVSSTLRRLTPENPVTIGVPLPTYTVVILDEHKDEVVPDGAIGEIGIAGVALALGYLNREDLTRQKFIPDFLNLPNNPSKRIYRTGDYGRIRDDGELEFHGRIDTQVKIRGYRIELEEIEAVLLQVPQISQAVVNPYEPEPGAVELVGYYTRKQGAPEVSSSEISEMLRKHLPSYMVPGYLEELPAIPMTPNNKADRKNLPAPKGSRFAASSGKFVAPNTETEKVLAGALSEVMKIERVVHRRQFLPGPRRALAADGPLWCRDPQAAEDFGGVDAGHLSQSHHRKACEAYRCAAGRGAGAGRGRAPRAVLRSVEFRLLRLRGATRTVVSRLERDRPLDPGDGDPNGPMRRCRIPRRPISASWSMPSGFRALFSAIPIAAKRLVIGTWKPEVIPVWSLRYFRFWAIRSLIGSAPMALFGDPFYNLYLRLLGAKVGENTVIHSTAVPVCTDLISIGDNTILGKDSIVLGYAAQSNYIYTGPVQIGSNAFVGEAGVLDINTVMEDDTQLGHASSLHNGQRIPKGKHYHGCPAQETTANYCPVEPMRVHAAAALDLCERAAGRGVPLDADPGGRRCMRGSPTFIGRSARPSSAMTPRCWILLLLTGQTLLITFATFFSGVIFGLLGIAIVPRILNLFLRQGQNLRPLWLPLFHPADDRVAQQFGVLQSSVRRQLGDRLLRALGRLSLEQDRADRLEFRHEPAPRKSVPLRHRQRHDDLRRAEDDERDDVEFVVQARHGEDRRAELPRQLSALSGRRQNRRQRPGCDQGLGADRRPHSRECWTARVAVFRDSARHRARQADGARWTTPPGAGSFRRRINSI